MMAAVTLTEFLLARIAEDEAAARTLTNASYQDPVPSDCWAPERVLAECEAKRRIVERAERNRTDLMRDTDNYSWNVRVLSEVYADHPDYRESWRP